MDSWIYPAMERLYSLGYIDTAFLGLRPWTRLSCLHMLQQSQAKIFDESTRIRRAIKRRGRSSNALAHELWDDRDALDPGEFNGHAEVDRLYARAMYVGGTPLNDSSHFGSTLINDYGRAYEGGFNGLTGFSARAEDVRLSLEGARRVPACTRARRISAERATDHRGHGPGPRVASRHRLIQPMNSD